jgi:hypothetical protein
VFGSLGADTENLQIQDSLPRSRCLLRIQATAVEMRLDTFGSQFDTVLAARPEGCADAPIASNNDAEGTTQSRLDLSGLTIGAVYTVQVDSASTTRGAFKLTLAESEPAPVGDECQDSLDALAIPSQTTGSTFFATDNSAPSAGEGAGPDVAYKITVTAGADLVVDTLGSKFDTVLYLRSGSARTGIASTTTLGGKPRIALESRREDYFVFVDGKSIMTGGFHPQRFGRRSASQRRLRGGSRNPDSLQPGRLHPVRHQWGQFLHLRRRRRGGRLPLYPRRTDSGDLQYGRKRVRYGSLSPLGALRR